MPLSSTECLLQSPQTLSGTLSLPFTQALARMGVFWVLAVAPPQGGGGRFCGLFLRELAERALVPSMPGWAVSGKEERPIQDREPLPSPTLAAESSRWCGNFNKPPSIRRVAETAAGYRELITEEAVRPSWGCSCRPAASLCFPRCSVLCGFRPCSAAPAPHLQPRQESYSSALPGFTPSSRPLRH